MCNSRIIFQPYALGVICCSVLLSLASSQPRVLFFLVSTESTLYVILHVLDLQYDVQKCDISYVVLYTSDLWSGQLSSTTLQIMWGSLMITQLGI